MYTEITLTISLYIGTILPMYQVPTIIIYNYWNCLVYRSVLCSRTVGIRGYNTNRKADWPLLMNKKNQ